MPGVGYDYVDYDDNGTWAENAVGTVPSGTYESFEPISNLQGCPVNGVWTLEICDLWGADNGFVFNWGIQLDSENVYASAPVSSCPVGCTNAEACNLIQRPWWTMAVVSRFSIWAWGNCSDAKMFLNECGCDDIGEPLLGVCLQRFFLRVKRGIRSELVARRVWLLQFVLRRLFVWLHNLLSMEVMGFLPSRS